MSAERSRALCAPENLRHGASADDWFAEPHSTEWQQAMKTCVDCPLYHPCAEYAIREGIPDGVFGGMPARERKQIWRRQGRFVSLTTHLAVYDHELRALTAKPRDRGDAA